MTRGSATRGRGRPGADRAVARRARPGQVRIIAGRFRGRRLPVAAATDLRPTPERSRETLFNWLQGRLEGARVLDAFAGSGALGFEALSRGAAHVVLLERDRRLAESLATVAAGLDPERCEVVAVDALRWPRSLVPPFDLVLLDPPFAGAIAAAALAHLRSAGLLAPGAHVYCEVDAAAPRPWLDPIAGDWEVLRETRAGNSLGALLRAVEAV